MPSDTIMRFRSNYPNLLSVKDSVLVEKDIYAYSDGKLNFNFELPLFEISTVAWNTLLNTGMSQSYSFECLMKLQATYKGTEKVISLNEELISTLSRSKDIRADREKILRVLALVLQYEKVAIKVYENSPEELKNCS